MLFTSRFVTSFVFAWTLSFRFVCHPGRSQSNSAILITLSPSSPNHAPLDFMVSHNPGGVPANALALGFPDATSQSMYPPTPPYSRHRIYVRKVRGISPGPLALGVPGATSYTSTCILITHNYIIRETLARVWGNPPNPLALGNLINLL